MVNFLFFSPLQFFVRSICECFNNQIVKRHLEMQEKMVIFLHQGTLENVCIRQTDRQTSLLMPFGGSARET